jgi:hypothetical protein
VAAAKSSSEFDEIITEGDEGGRAVRGATSTSIIMGVAAA